MMLCFLWFFSPHVSREQIRKKARGKFVIAQLKALKNRDEYIEKILKKYNKLKEYNKNKLKKYAKLKSKERRETKYVDQTY